MTEHDKNFALAKEWVSRKLLPKFNMHTRSNRPLGNVQTRFSLGLYPSDVVMEPWAIGEPPEITVKRTKLQGDYLVGITLSPAALGWSQQQFRAELDQLKELMKSGRVRKAIEAAKQWEAK